MRERRREEITKGRVPTVLGEEATAEELFAEDGEEIAIDPPTEEELAHAAELEVSDVSDEDAARYFQESEEGE